MPPFSRKVTLPLIPIVAMLKGSIDDGAVIGCEGVDSGLMISIRACPSCTVARGLTHLE